MPLGGDMPGMRESSRGKKSAGVELSDMLTDVSIREGGQQAVDLRHAGIDTKLDFMSLAVGGGNLDIRRLIRVYNRLRRVHGFDEEAVLRIVQFLKLHTRRDISNISL